MKAAVTGVYPFSYQHLSPMIYSPFYDNGFSTWESRLVKSGVSWLEGFQEYLDFTTDVIESK